jgi:hypothetical protein
MFLREEVSARWVSLIEAMDGKGKVRRIVEETLIADISFKTTY